MSLFDALKNMTCEHDGRAHRDDLFGLAIRSKQTLQRKWKKAKPGTKGLFVSTNMLASSGKLNKRKFREQMKEKKETKPTKKKETQREKLLRLEKEVAKLEGRTKQNET